MNVVTPSNTLLAKPSQVPGAPRKSETLAGHLEDVGQVSSSIMDAIGGSLLNTFGIGQFHLEQTRQALILAAYMHDLGKANNQFQRALDSHGPWRQALRHEWISAWLPLRFPELDRWFFADRSETVKNAVLFAILGHHLKAKDGNEIKEQPGSGEASVTVFCGLPDFALCLALLASNHVKLAKGAPPTLKTEQIPLAGRPLSELRDWLPDALQWFQSADHETKAFIAIIKALLVASDVAGSAVPKAGVDLQTWTESVLKRACTRDELEAIAESGLKGRTPRGFQARVADSSSQVTFAKAGCGSGKTTAAYLWAARRASGRKLFYCYPTTGTATEGFRDYILPAGTSGESLLLHSRSEYDLEYLSLGKEEGLEASRRLEALLAWDIPIVICTVDQVLGLVQNARKPLFTFPSIANGTFVFDEIHQYDDRLFGSLLRFLEVVKEAPVLFMTATLPTPRLDAIREMLKRRGATLETIVGPPDLERIPRYLVESPVESPPWNRVTDVLKQGGKILWVANTVDRCVGFVQDAKKRGLAPLPYHSRYRYCDRLERHNAVIDAFKKKLGVLAVTTQVCEVSLDISADMLLMDLATVPALIQRLGRLNRRVTPEEPGQPKPAIILTPEGEKPYEMKDLELAKQWLQKIGGGPVSQSTLAEAFEGAIQSAPVAVASDWLDGGPFSGQSSVRDADTTIPVIRAEDEHLCLQNGKLITKELIRYSIPMLLGPVANEINRWKRFSYVFIAPEGRIDYSTELGAKWAKK